MRVLALDLGVRMGVARGPAEQPTSGAVVLKRPDENISVAFGNLIHWLSAEFKSERPDLVVVEAGLPLQAFKTLFNSEARIKADHGYHAILLGMGNRFGIKVEAINQKTVRKHFIGTGANIVRAELKRAVVARCQQLGYFEAGKYDEDEADALAIWDYGHAVFGRSIPKEITLFTEQKLPKRRRRVYTSG